MLKQRLETYLNYIHKNPQYYAALKKCRDEKTKKPGDEELFLICFAPAITAFAEWVLREALKKGLKRLYFLSRDGYMPLKVSEKLKQALGTDIELRYLNVSRYSLRCAEYYIAGEGSLDTICTGGMNITFEKMMKRAMLTDEECRRIAGAVGMADCMDETLDYRKIQRLKEKLRSVPGFFEMVKAHAGQPYENACGYLEQEGFFDETKKGIVDLGWIGTVQQSLSRLSDQSFDGYYFGLYEIPRSFEGSLLKAGDYHSFYISESKNLHAVMTGLKRKKYFSICLFEAVCSSPESMTVSYEKDSSGRFFPKGSESANPNEDRIKRYAQIIDRFASAYAGEMKSLASYEETPDTKMIQSIFDQLMGDPLADEADFLGDLKFCDDVLESELEEVAKVLPYDVLKRSGLLGILSGRAGLSKSAQIISGWPEGSIARSLTSEKDKALRRKAIKAQQTLRLLTGIRKAF